MSDSRLSTIFRRSVIFEWILIGVIVAEVLYFLWLFITPAPPAAPSAVPADATQVIASNPDLPAGGGLALPAGGVAPAAAAGGNEAAAIGEDLHLYLVIDNAGGPVTLVGASATGAEEASLWTAGLAGAPAAPTDGIPIAANGETTLDDARGWVLLSGLTREFRKGERIDVTLEFDGADPVTIAAPIYRTRETAAENPEPAHEAGALSIGAYWARPFDQGA